MAFLSDRSEKTQIYRISLGGGEAERLTDLEEGVSTFAWSPNGEFIVLSAPDAKNAAIENRKKRFGDFHWEDEDHQMTHFWKLTLDRKELDRITEGQDFTVRAFAISPGSDRVAFTAQPFPNPDARVPIPNAYELHQGLRDQNVPVRLAVYRGFGHGITKPKSNRAVMTHNEEWFGRWIWDDRSTKTTNLVFVSQSQQ